jgi:hypothetical protein
VTCYTEGFSHFVTSMTAPVASGWSVRRVGLAKLESAAFSRRTQIADAADGAWSSVRSEALRQADGSCRASVK